MSVVLEAQESNRRPIAKPQLSLIREFELLTTTIDGVPKLRQLIRSLAARGLLTPQSKSDESADELLARLDQLKRAHAAASRAKAVEAKNDLLESLTGFALPHGWVWASLSELGSFASGKTPSTDKADYWNGRIPWVTPKDMKSMHVVDSEDHVTEKAVVDGLALVPERAVLVVVRSGILRRTVPVAIAAVRCTINQDLKALTLYEPAMAPYVHLLIAGFEPFILANLTKVGTTVESIKFDDFSGCRFPIPPLAEQQRIVARVEELMKLCDALEQSGRLADAQHSRLTSTLFDALATGESAHALAENWQRAAENFDLLLDRQEAVDAFEQSIVQLALRGHLVRQEQGDEPASQLFERIQSGRSLRERNRLQDQSEAMVGKPEHHEGLPSGWCSARIGAIASVVTDGTHRTPTYASDGVMFVSAKDVRTGKLLFDGCKYITRQEHDLLTKRCKPERGDILVSKSGSIGTVVIVETNEDFSLFESLALIKYPQNELSGSYLQLAIQQACGSLREGDIKGVAVKHLHLNVLRSLPIALAPLNEQHRIVSFVENIRLLCANLRGRLRDARETQSRLADALISEVG